MERSGVRAGLGLIGLIGLTFVMAGAVRGEDLPLVTEVEHQPLAAQARRVAEALAQLGQPLSPADQNRLTQAIKATDAAEGVRAIQDILDPLCLVGVTINPESRVKAVAGPAKAELVQQGWRVFLIKVQNEAGVTAPLRAVSPNAAPLYKQSKGSPEPKPAVTLADQPERWMEIALFQDRPLTPTLSGLLLEYRILQIYSRDPGKREAKITFDVGQGTQDLGFRSDVDILFQCAPAVNVTLRILDEDGSPAVASLVFRDRLGRVYPAMSRRLAPDFFFHEQIYRKDGESVKLAPGVYTASVTRGPEYVVQTRTITVPDQSSHEERFTLKRWAHLSKLGWYSGDHHVHAAGCGHYDSPTQGVTPADMMRHILGEDLHVGCVLSWGPCWYFQKQFFEGKTHALSTPDNLMRYDVEVSGFPSSHAGHLCLLRLKEDDYPGTTRIEEWPSWDLPVLRWGKSQGGVVGFSHSGWGLKTKKESIPNDEIPPFDGIGANEYIVDVVHDAVDFISTVDTPAPWELNIWYHTLNCGYKCRISGETDFPCIYGERVGLGRVYVKFPPGEALDFDAYCARIKDGRSYVSDGKSHLIDFQVNETALGENGGTLSLAKPGQVTAKARVQAYLEPVQTPLTKRLQSLPLSEKPYWDVERARIGDTRKVPVELIVNGRAVGRTEILADGSIQDVSFPVTITHSSWLALRILPSSHTNPIWVEVAKQPVRASKKSADWCLKAVDQCWSQKKNAIRPAERAAAAAAFDTARAAYRRIKDEAVAD